MRGKQHAIEVKEGRRHKRIRREGENRMRAPASDKVREMAMEGSRDLEIKGDDRGPYGSPVGGNTTES